SGGSGAQVARRVIDLLLEEEVPVVVTCSTAGRQVWQQELGASFASAVHSWAESPLFTYHPVGQIGAPIASGTFVTAGMLVIPCSMATVAAIAHGMADNLLRRAADVTIKERRPLVVMPRETPLSSIHLENLQRLAQLGVTVMVPAPAFYLHPRTVDDIVEYLARKSLAVLDPSGRSLPEALTYRGFGEPGPNGL
ncbi:MAG: UbiX family flavin prenyltransferase, partial [Chloroflexi bacterium]|nr:UbiX family flavin prenyltransferase [Chloroflexota bacterium]